jgi:hypothetical protein
MAYLTAILFLLSFMGAAHAEPVSLSLFIASVTGAYVSVGAVTTALYLGASIAVTAGASLLQRALMKQKTESANLDALANQNLEKRTGVADREMVLGETQKSGVVVYEEVRGPYLYRMWVIAAHEIESVVGVKINGALVPLDVAGFPTSAPFRTPTRTYVQISVRVGTDDQEIDPILAADYPSLERTFRQRGLACVLAKMYRGATADEAEKVWGQGDPRFSFIVRGKKFYDPRDPTQVRDDPKTHKWTANAALCRAGWDHDPEGQGMDWDWENLDALKDAADICDEKVARADGTFEARYECHGVINTSQDPTTILQDLALNMLGTFVSTADQISYIAGKSRPSLATKTLGTARGDLDASSGRAWDDVINTVRTSFAAANDDYNVTDGPVYTIQKYLDEDGQEKSVTVTLPFCKSETQLQRIAKYLIEMSRLGRTIKRREDATALEMMPGEIYRYEYKGGLAVMNGEYMLSRLTDTELLHEFAVEMQEFDGIKLFGWDPTIDEQQWVKSSQSDLEAA